MFMCICFYYTVAAKGQPNLTKLRKTGAIEKPQLYNTDFYPELFESIYWQASHTYVSRLY